jgi:tRNA threonylcarbamoyladenosine biosynthesis protein TsaE
MLFNENYALTDLPLVALKIAKLLEQCPILCFDAPMGAGKTTLIAEVCAVLGVPAVQVSSPTYSIVNEYESALTQKIIYHFDCYRLQNLHEAQDVGIEDYLYSQNICLIEWYNVVQPLLPVPYMLATIYIHKNERTVQIVWVE